MPTTVDNFLLKHAKIEVTATKTMMIRKTLHIIPFALTVTLWKTILYIRNGAPILKICNICKYKCRHVTYKYIFCRYYPIVILKMLMLFVIDKIKSPHPYFAALIMK